MYRLLHLETRLCIPDFCVLMLVPKVCEKFHFQRYCSPHYPNVGLFSPLAFAGKRISTFCDLRMSLSIKYITKSLPNRIDATKFEEILFLTSYDRNISFTFKWLISLTRYTVSLHKVCIYFISMKKNLYMVKDLTSSVGWHCLPNLEIS